ncbi:MAG: hypothetical protein JNN05_08465 [Candidatus Omnitrophica bacterium]|nr:hypothetical protein [Candidatus Omnitrophota bacterium]
MVVKADTTDLRNLASTQAMVFKQAWIPLAQALYSIWRDKSYHAWGYEEFEQYLGQELGMKKSLAMKLIKTYFFVEQSEPKYLDITESDGIEAANIPGVDALDVLRKARAHKDLTREDYAKLRSNVFQKGKHEGLVAKELTALIKERKQVDPVEEREKRATKSINNVVHALHVFTKEMEILKTVSDEIVINADDLRKQIVKEAQ